LDQKGIGTGIIAGIILSIIAGVFGCYFLVVNSSAKSNSIASPTGFTQTNQYSDGGYMYTSYSGSGTTQDALSTFKTQMQSQGWIYEAGGGTLGGYSGDLYEKGDQTAVVSASQAGAGQVVVLVVTGTKATGGGGEEPAPQPQTSGTISSAQVSPSTVEEGGSTTAYVGVNNTGNTDTTFQVEMTSSSGTVSKQTYLSQSQSSTLTFDLTPSRSDSSISFTLYADGKLLDTRTSSISVLYANLEIQTQNESDSWGRGADDLPTCTSTVSFAIINNGTGPARNVSLTLDVGGTLTSLGTISYLGAGQSYRDNWSRSLSRGYKYIETVPFIEKCYGDMRLEAETAFTSDTVNYSFSDPLYRNRYYDPEYISLFITPNDPYVQTILQGILENKAWYDPNPDWEEIRDWVASHITYAYDDQVHGGDYIQLPRETIMLGHGDCEDFATLLVSLYRAYDVSSGDTYVALGILSGETLNGHAYVLYDTHLPVIGWWVVEPQAGGLFSPIDDFFTNIEYNDEIFFNDVNYIDLNSQTLENPIAVVDSKWIANGQQTTSCQVGDSVQAYITVNAEWELLNGTLTIEVWKDLSWWPDSLCAQGSFHISLSKRESQSIPFTWSPDQASGTGGNLGIGELSGYCMRVLFDGREVWVMSDSYPPSLRAY